MVRGPAVLRFTISVIVRCFSSGGVGHPGQVRVAGPGHRLGGLRAVGGRGYYIKTRFRHSKLQPLKQEIYDVQAHQRKIQRDATNMKHGKPTEYDWDWPEETVVRRRSPRRSIGRRRAAELEVGAGEGGVV